MARDSQKRILVGSRDLKLSCSFRTVPEILPLAAIPPALSLRAQFNSYVLGTPPTGCVSEKDVLPRQRAEGRGQGAKKSGGLLGTRLALNCSLWPAYHGVAEEEDGDLGVVLLNGVHVLQHVSDKNVEVRYHHPLSLALPVANWK